MIINSGYRVFITGILFCLVIEFITVVRCMGLEPDNVIYFTNLNGLPQNVITCVEQDKYGYTWFGTRTGVCRFDGNNFVTYDQLKGETIAHLCVDSGNNLWVASDQGVYFYNRLTDYFELKSEGFVRDIHEKDGRIFFMFNYRILQYDHPEIKQIISGSEFREFYVNDKGIWYCSSYDGIKLLDYSGDIAVISKTFLKGKSVSVIAEFDGILLAGCRNGELFSIDRDGNSKKIPLDNRADFREIIVVENEIWLATDGNGIIVLDRDFNFLKSYMKDPQNPSFLPSNSIYDIFQGSDREIWIATYGMGVVCIMPGKAPFKNIVPEPGNNNSLVANEGVMVFSDDGRFYFGTNYGLSEWEEKTGRFLNLDMMKLKSDLNGSKVLAFNVDNNDNRWIGVYDGLLGKYSPDYRLIKSYFPCGRSLSEMQQIIFIHKSGNSNFLIGSHYPNRSLINFDLNKETFTPFEISYGEYTGNNFQIISVRKNKEGKLLAAIRNMGLFTVNVSQNTLEDELPEINKRVTFRINDFHHDRNGHYWLATQKDGLIRMSADGREFDKWTISEGMPTNTIQRIESVDDTFLWLSTISGLCRFSTEDGQIVVFTNRHGLPANEFNSRTSTVTSDGRIVFGSTVGFTIINPDLIEPDTSKTEVIISDITFHNQSIRRLEDRNYLTGPLEETKMINLPFRRNSFTIHFFSKDKNLPKYNNFVYRLQGLEDEWIYLGEINHTTYTNLSPGNYTFEVKSTNKSNVWMANPTQLNIRIMAPWYATWYACLIYASVGGVLIFASLTEYRKRLNLKKEVEISEFKVQKEKELTEKKLAFFTNISHDLKTPLTLIDAPTNDLLQSGNLNHDQISKLKVILKNSRRLYKLISDLLDFRRLTQNQLPLKVSESDIGPVISSVCEAFREECRVKSIELVQHIDVQQPVFADARKIEKILWNLLSNSVKFTEEGDEIFLSAEVIIRHDEEYLKMIVKDTGIGIPEKEQSKIFERFYQSDEHIKTKSQGTGIGLSIVKDLIFLHHGEISVKSSPGKGTTFTLLIPVDRSNYSEEELDLVEYNARDRTEKILMQESIRVPEFSDEHIPNHYNLPKLLIVEDNKELREYLADHFSKSYKICQAADGDEGLGSAQDKSPDIILTDILMPNMNGYDFCRAIRSNFDTSHIPLIMLTANNTVEQQIEGLTIGADAYLTKPFDIKLLDTLLKSVLENRKKLRDKLLGREPSDIQRSLLPPKDLLFIDQVHSFIEVNIAEPELNIFQLSHNFGISRTQLYRKLKSLTGQTPNNLIKTIRLRKAYDLIVNQRVRVSEAAYQTGFSDPNYFTTCFKKEFGENPSQVADKLV